MAYKRFQGHVKMAGIDTSSVTDTIMKFHKLMNAPSTVLDYTFKDMRNRAPGKISSAVTQVYGIKKSEIQYKVYSANRKDFSYSIQKMNAGNIVVKGETLRTMEFYYAGRKLTPLHFGMTPKARPSGKKKYKVKAKILKNKLANFRNETKHPEGAVFLAPAKKGSSTIIPWFRNSSDPDDIEPIKTVSLPAMIGPNREGKGGNPIVMKNINKSLAALLHERYDHHLSRFIKGNL